MLSITEMAILGVGALLLFGPEQLPGIMKKAGRVMRDVQNTSQGFIREMERAADDLETPPPYAPPPYEPPVAHHADPTTEADVLEELPEADEPPAVHHAEPTTEADIPPNK